MLFNIYFISDLLMGALTGWLAFFAWEQRSVPGARAYAGLALSECFLALTEMLSMLSSEPVQALFWFNLRFLFAAAMPVLFLVFAVEYNGHKGWLPKRVVAAAFIIPILTQFILWTNNLSGFWVKQEVSFSQSGPFLISDTSSRIPGIWFLVYSFYSLLILFVGIIVILATAWHRPHLSRFQVLLLSSGALVALIATLFPTFNLVPHGGINPFIPGVGASALLYALAIFRFQFLKRSPIMAHNLTTTPPKAQGDHSLALFALIFLIMAAGISAIGYFSYTNYAEYYRSQIESQLSSVGTLKISGLQNWRSERLANAEIFSKNPGFSMLVQRFLEKPSDASIKAELQSWLDLIITNRQYNRVFFLDTSGIERISTSNTPEPVSAHLVQELNAYLNSDKVIFLDFHRDSADNPIHLALLVPIYSNAGNHALGLLVLQIDPQIYLYPFIQQWPVPSSSAETLLVRKDRENVLFLNTLRFEADTALNLRIPLSNTHTPAVQAVLGQTGIVEGIDYRGVAVIADIRKVPDSTWFLVSLEDTAEVYGPLQDHLWQTIAFMGTLILAGAGGLTLAWRQQQVRSYQASLKTADALRESEEKFRQAFQISPDTIAISRLYDGQYVSVNESFTKILGYSSTEAIENSSKKLNIWDNLADREKLIDGLQVNGIVENFEAKLRSKSGKLLDALISAALIELNGEPHIIISGRDITERLQTEKAMRRQNEYFLALQETTLELLSQIDPDALLEQIVKRAGLLIGTSSGFLDLVEPETGMLIPKVGIGNMADSLNHQVNLGEGVSGWIWQTGQSLVVNDYDQWPGRNRSFVPGSIFSIVAVPLKYGSQVLGVLGLGHNFGTQRTFEPEDVELLTQFGRLAAIAIENTHLYSAANQELAERKRAEETLSLIFERQQALLASIPDIVMEVDLDQIYTWANQAGIEFFGENLIGKNAAYYFEGDHNTNLKAEAQVDTEPKVIHFENWQKRKDGEKRLLAWWRREVKDANGNVIGALSSARDITEQAQQETQILAARAALQELLSKAEQSRRALLSVVEDQKMAEEEIRRLNEDLEQRVAARTAQLAASNKELETFAYSVSHDLRAPLRAIDGFSRILQEGYAQKLDSEGMRLLDVVRDNTKRMDHLITDLLALSRVGRSELQYSPIDMATMANSIYHELATPEVLERFVFRVSGLPYVTGDPTLMRQVWANLISNSIKYTTPIGDPAAPGGKRECVIEVSGWIKDGYCTYEIKDNGVGFNPKYSDKLFGLFQRLHKAGEFEGTGVGLAIVQRIIHRHGGKVWGEGQVGAGASFYFTITERQVSNESV